MHPIQEKLLKLADDINLGGLSFRKIGEHIGVSSAQKIKHHLLQLEKRGLISYDKIGGILHKTRQGKVKNSPLIAIPIVGAANCGEAKIFAEEDIEGYLRVSGNLLKKWKGIFAIKAVGNSMNRASVGGKSIEDGDYAIIDYENQTPENNEYVLSIIDGVANIKKFVYDKVNEQVVLLSESTKTYSPIYIHPRDAKNYLVNGRVVQVIKSPHHNHL